MPRMSIRSIRYRRPDNPTWDTELEARIRPEMDSLSEPLDLEEFFGRNAPIEVEIGFGKGRFLMAAAEKSPEHNWLGMEYAVPCVMLAAERSARKELDNVRILHGAAEDLIPRFLPDRSIHAFHVYFPDPWPKKRHHKRRLIKPSLVAELRRALRPGGDLHVATDFTEYYQAMIPVITGEGFSLEEHPDPAQDQAFLTNYEMRFLDQGKPIHRARFSAP